MKKQRPGSWSVLIAGMALSYALAKWVTSKLPYLFLPVSLFVRFITDRYSEEINAMGAWISRLCKSIWNLFRRRNYAT